MNKNILKTVGGLLGGAVVAIGSVFVGRLIEDGVGGLIDDHEAKRIAKGHEVLEEAIKLCEEENKDSED